MSQDEKAFLGSGWSFPPKFNTSMYEVEVVTAEEDVKQSLYILLSTKPGERVMHPEFGCGIQSLVFETINQSLFAKIEDLIRKAVIRYESRIRLDEVKIQYDPKVQEAIFITLEYVIKEVNTRQNMVFPFYLMEGTNLKGIK